MRRFDGRRHNVYLTWDGIWRNYVAEGDEAGGGGWPSWVSTSGAPTV
jgi:hypothetical protein